MRVYLDICCLKRPFEDQSQPRIRVESEVVLTLLGLPPDRVQFVRAAAHDLENSQNRVLLRATRVRAWMQRMPLESLSDQAVRERTTELIALGFHSFDAFHLASGEGCGADVFATCDDRLLAAARRHAAVIKLRVVNPLDLIKDF